MIKFYNNDDEKILYKSFLRFAKENGFYHTFQQQIRLALKCCQKSLWMQNNLKVLFSGETLPLSRLDTLLIDHHRYGCIIDKIPRIEDREFLEIMFGMHMMDNRRLSKQMRYKITKITLDAERRYNHYNTNIQFFDIY